MSRTRAAVLTTAAVLGVVGLSACSAYTTKPGSASRPAPTQATTQPDTEQAGENGTRLVAAQVGNLGTVVTDGKGFTLYRFEKDSNKPAASNCDGTCATQWPPLLVTDATIAVSGVDKSLVGTVTRKDGSRQVTIDSWPVYRYAKDGAPGEAKGQGVGGIWFAVTPQGRKAVATTDNSGSGYGY
jgi:predicted lipoprotein with Yx(FWY)xxD motif